MKTYSLMLLFAVSGAALASGSFGDRVQCAKIVEVSADGEAYQRSLWKQVGAYTATVMQRCVPKVTKVDTDSYALVASILPSQVLANIELQPETKMSKCFAEGFSRAPFPKPPERFGEDGIPIVIEMRVTP